MKLLQYKHDRKLRHTVAERKIILSPEMFRAADTTTVLSFSVLSGCASVHEFVNGTSRFLIDLAGDVALINIQNDSPFYPHILWDVAHQMQVGSYIYIKESIQTEGLLERSYYKGAFRFLMRNEYGCDVYEKYAPLPIEQDAGLDGWSFCIPVGPDEPTFLNACVARILSLEIPQKEIVLCGRPHPDFRYFDQVRIVGEDIPAPPVHITRKKNVLAEAARYSNLCIIHDRVLLPTNFYAAMQRFGDYYPFTGLQSFYFVDKSNLIPRKYSDFNSIEQDLTRELDINRVTKKDLPLISKLFYCYQHPARAQFGHDYLTGSLYLTKKSLWLFCRQNEALYWNDYEDIEHGIRASEQGIPVIINPYTISQSMNARSVIHYYGYVSIRDYRGKLRMSRSVMELLPFLPRKPLFRISQDEARARMFAFAKKYGATRGTLLSISSAKLSGMTRYFLIVKLMKDVTVPLPLVETFVDDFMRNVLCEEIAPNELTEVMRKVFSSDSPGTKKGALVGSFILNNQLFHSYIFSPFYLRLDDWFVRRSKISVLCTLFSAWYLKYRYAGSYLPFSVKEIARLLDMTTPYINQEDNNDIRG